MPKYYGMVKCLDDNVGRILESLRKNKILDRTVIVFTSDHGDLCGEHGRLNKGVPYEGSARIPFLLHCPGKVPAGTIVNEALSCVDFLPTTLSLMEVKTVGKEQGRDASALFRGEGKNWNDVAFIRSTSAGKPWLCAVADDHKLVFSAMDEPWLFDLAKDPDEMDNCYEISKYSKVVLRLTKALESYCRKYEDPYGEVPEIKAAIKQALGKK
jgi:arylsulfatase A-like enzyme